MSLHQWGAREEWEWRKGWWSCSNNTRRVNRCTKERPSHFQGWGWREGGTEGRRNRGREEWREVHTGEREGLEESKG